MARQISQAGADTIVCGTAVVGSGAAGYSAALRLWQYGQRDILLLTENRMAGTSRNTGSDKQTYYKLTLSGDEPDSVGEMARTLFQGGCVDGDIALCEAALSAQGFLRLVELGVPFPRDRYGQFVGYKTDHDPRRRATSVGPYTSRQMTERLEAAAQAQGIPLLDHVLAVQILSDGEKAYGLLCLDTAAGGEEPRFVLIRCRNIVWATGGPAGMYADSVYPAGHHGATGLALEAGAKGRNLTEWQYGLASVRPRWNVSGTYMQVLPRVYSCRPDGGDEREFLMDLFDRPADMLSKLFLKGYQWPFDVRKVDDGSSIIDILVYLETQKGRKVYLDYRADPLGGNFSYDELEPEALTYLRRAGACFGTPIQRLQHMNAPAVEFYRDRGIDLAVQPLEIALCAQHNNGGLAVDCWWRTDVEGLFAVGEAAGSHGVYRPGGSALNAGQVGSTRAAQYIAARRPGLPGEEDEAAFTALAAGALEELGGLAQAALARGGDSVRQLWVQAGRRMSECGGAIRNERALRQGLEAVRETLRDLPDRAGVRGAGELFRLFLLRDTLIGQRAYLSAMLDYIVQGGRSRGSALYTDPAGRKPYGCLPDAFTFALDDGGRSGLIQEISCGRDGGCEAVWRPVRPIPEEDDFFENIWRSYRETGNID